MADGWFSLLTGFAGVVVGSATTMVRDWRIDRRRDAREVAYLAVTVAGRLEQFARQCADVADDDGLFRGQPNERGFHEAQAPLPELELETLPVDWKSLPGSLLYDILDLPYQLRTIHSLLESTYEYDSPPDFTDFFSLRRTRFALLGTKALTLARRLRKRAKFDQHGDNDMDSLHARLLWRTEDLARQQERREARHVALAVGEK